MAGRLGALVLLAAAFDGCGSLAFAQGNLEASYVATLAGVPIGKGSWSIDVTEDQFTATASGATSGLLRVFASGQGSSVAHGGVSGGQPVASTYASTIMADNKTDQVRMLFGGGAVKDYLADPPTMPGPDRMPLTEAHRKGVFDPMTATLLRVPGNGDTFVPEACQRTVPVFDGRMRYDLQLAFKHLDKVRSERGMEVSLAPIAGTRLMVPYRASIPTPLGMGVLQATQFVSVPRSPQQPTANLKTQ